MHFAQNSHRHRPHRLWLEGLLGYSNYGFFEVLPRELAEPSKVSQHVQGVAAAVSRAGVEILPKPARVQRTIVFIDEMLRRGFAWKRRLCIRMSAKCGFLATCRGRLGKAAIKPLQRQAHHDYNCNFIAVLHSALPALGVFLQEVRPRSIFFWRPAPSGVAAALRGSFSD